jgi:CMP-N,N'-diacetyllegionaminic acid synthase
MYIIALIPCRSGSKGLPNKNIKNYNGLPLIAHSILLAKKCKFFNKVYVTTDSKKYQDIALQYGANILDVRPKEISDDLSPDIDFFKHFIQWTIQNNLKIPDIIVHLRPTYPNRTLELLNDCMIQFLNNYENYDSLRTVVPIKKSPYKMYYIEKNNLIPYFKKNNQFIEPFNQARQYFPDTYLHNGCIDIVKTKIINENVLSGQNILPYIMNDIDDIDDLEDFCKSENKLLNNG